MTWIYITAAVLIGIILLLRFIRNLIVEFISAIIEYLFS